mmetsp:Transcript_9864/g.12919  ORF Transcript_9864/g.12919 Transcript_9864/m.12919 type:complete len:143 (+) Transcript_9864:124-552(+)
MYEQRDLLGLKHNGWSQSDQRSQASHFLIFLVVFLLCLYATLIILRLLGFCTPEKRCFEDCREQNHNLVVTNCRELKPGYNTCRSGLLCTACGKKYRIHNLFDNFTPDTPFVHCTSCKAEYCLSCFPRNFEEEHAAGIVSFC